MLSRVIGIAIGIANGIANGITGIGGPLAALAVSAPVHAQGCDGLISDPMSSREFAALLRRHVQPTASQWLVLHTMHEDYIAAAIALRDGEIEDILVERTRRMGGVFDPAVERGLEPRRRRASAALGALDARLFDDAAALLGESHRDGIEGVRMQRERQRLGEEIQRTGISPRGEGDLTPAVLDVRWTPEERQRVVPVLRGYQAHILGLMRKLAEVALDASPFEPARDPHHLAAVDEARRLKSEMQKAHRGVLKELAIVVTPERMRQVRRRWIERHYPQLWMPRDAPVPARLALRSTALTQEQRTALASMVITTTEQDDRLVEQAMARLDELATAREIRGAMDAPDERLAELITARKELQQSAREQVIALLGKPEFVALERRGWNVDLDEPGPPIDATEPVRDPPAPAERVEDAPPFESCTRPLTIHDCAAIAAAAGLSAEALAHANAEIESAHAAYEERWRGATEEAQRSYTQLLRGAPGGPDPLFGPANELRVRCGAVDASLFDAIGAALGPSPEALRALRVARLDRAFTLWTSLPISATYVVTRAPMPFNPLRILRLASLEERSTAALVDIVLRRADSMLAATETFQRDMANADGDPLVRGRRIWASRTAATKEFAALREELVAAADETERARLETLFLRAAYPAIADPRDAGIAIRAVVHRKDLSDIQREQLTELRQWFDRRSLDVCRRLLPAPLAEPQSEHDLSRMMVFSGDEAVRAERGRFERDELNAHAITRLRTLLTAEQQADVPELARLDAFEAPLETRER